MYREPWIEDMANITYPTINLLDDFLRKVYGYNGPVIQTEKLGVLTDYYDSDQPGMFETIPVNVTSITGIDVPILVTNDTEDKAVVAIIAQDPLRSTKDDMLAPFKPFANPIVGTPFALHYKQSVYPETEIYRLIIKKILDKGFNVYITDAHKIYSSQNAPKQCGKNEREMLIKEFDVIKPNFIIIFGSEAKKYVSGYITSTYQGKILELLHPSKTNWDHWKQWIFEQAFYDRKTCNINWKEYATQIGCRSNMFGNYEPVNMQPMQPMLDVISNIVMEMFNSLSRNKSIP